VPDGGSYNNIPDMYLDARDLFLANSERESGPVMRHCESVVFCQCSVRVLYVYEYTGLHREEYDVSSVVGIRTRSVELCIVLCIHTVLWI
jgi:hypothetical protein